MATRNIGGDPNDPNYRYKMQRMSTRIEGRGNGIKTRILNMHEMSRSMHRNPAYVTKWFGCELGAQSKYVEKTQLSVVNGAHDVGALDQVLDGFINKWVLCPACHLPETDLYVRKGTIWSKCNACGADSRCDMGHRLATFIVKNPPVNKPKAVEKKRQNAQQEAQQIEASLAGASGDGGEDDWAQDTSEAAVEARRTEALGGKLKELAVSGDESAKVAAAAAAASAAAAAAAAAAELEEQGISPLAAQVRKFCHAANSCEAQIEFVKKLQKQEKFGNEQRAKLLFEALFDTSIFKRLKPHAPVIKRLCEHPRAQKAFLGQFEVFLQEHPKMMNRVNDILQGFLDILELKETAIIEWHASPSKTVDQAFGVKVRKAGQEFIEWLQEEEEEEDDEEEEEEDDDAVPLTTKPIVPSSNGAKKASAFAEEDDEDEDSDLDTL